MDEGQRADLVRACRDMLADGAENEEVLAILRGGAHDFADARGLVALVFGIGAEAAHEMIADSATWQDRREPLLDTGSLLDDFRRGD
ncbi:hypothetical protein [Iodidimonas sp. SYSU 1G8]|uniref:hypothetical protein n=1 Tax=Iodidimonas sp. SYSU 1G8 TaxID=3133967 RepID=UPI0031FEC23D